MTQALLVMLLVGGVLAAVVFAPLWSSRGERLQQERAVTVRLTLFIWLLAVLFAAGLLLVPDKQRVLMLAPLLAGAVIAGKLWKRARERARTQPTVDFERMKRVD